MVVLNYVAAPTIESGSALHPLLDVLSPPGSPDLLPPMPMVGAPDSALSEKTINCDSRGNPDVVLDRVVSLEEIVSLARFSDLSAEAMYQIANWAPNFRWLSREAYEQRVRGAWAIDVSGWSFDFCLDSTTAEIRNRTSILNFISSSLSGEKAPVAPEWNRGAFQVYAANDSTELTRLGSSLPVVSAGRLVAGDWRAIQYCAEFPDLSAECVWIDLSSTKSGSMGSVREVLRGAITGVMAEIVEYDFLEDWLSAHLLNGIDYMECVPPVGVEFVSGVRQPVGDITVQTKDWIRTIANVWTGMQSGNDRN